MRGMSSELKGCHCARQVQKSVASLSRESCARTAEGEGKERYEEEGAFHRCAILRDKVAEVNVKAGSLGKYCVG